LPLRKFLERAQDAITSALGRRPTQHFVVTNQFADSHAALLRAKPRWLSTAVTVGKVTSLRAYGEQL